MARWYEPTPEQEAVAKSWLDEKSPKLRPIFEKFMPWELYRLESTGQRCTILGFTCSDDEENVTVTVAITGKFNFLNFGRAVYGIKPEELTPCELPGPDELLGEYMNEEQALEVVNTMRAENGLSPLTIDEIPRFKDGVARCAAGD